MASLRALLLMLRYLRVKGVLTMQPIEEQSDRSLGLMLTRLTVSIAQEHVWKHDGYLERTGLFVVQRDLVQRELNHRGCLRSLQILRRGRGQWPEHPDLYVPGTSDAEAAEMLIDVTREPRQQGLTS